VQAAARAHGARVALRFEGTEWKWSEFDDEVSRVSRSLTARGVKAGEPVMLQAWNSPEVAWTFFACLRLGAIFVPINARLTAPEVAALPQVTTQPGVLAALFTSGTTGVPNVVRLTRENFEANARASAERMGAAPSHRWLGTLPLFHIGGLAMLYRVASMAGSIELEASFDAARVARALDAGVTHASLVPTMLDRVMPLIAPTGGGRGALVAILIGGGPMTSTTLKAARALGLPVLQTYGLTEACSQVTTELMSEADGTTAGPAIPGVQVRIVNPDAEGVGEIEVQGPTVALGFGPWLATKDLGRLDGRGRLTIFSRRTDLIVTGGENVYPAELEGVLREHPAIRDVAVGAREDAEWGQLVAAVVELDSAITNEELHAWARERLASFKVPRVWVRAPVPRNATGKVDRAALRRLVG
jgi:O-succinylbenzoic acid--CoA ligase